MNRQKEVKIILALCLVALTMIGCSKITPVANVEPKKENLIVATTSIPESLHASSYLRSRDEDIICALFEGLVEVTSEGKVAPALANGWKVSEDGLKYSFLLNEEVYWSDGKRIVASDFLDYFEYLFSPSNIDYTSDELYHIYGVKEFKDGDKGFDEVGIYAQEDNELIIQLVAKDPNFLKKLTKPEYRLRDTDDDLENYMEVYNDIRYTGAYRIESVNSTELKLVQNVEYTLKSIGAKNITLVNSGDNIKDFAMYNTNKLDIVNNPPVTAFNEGGLINEISFTDSANLQYMVLNSVNGIGKYLDFRKAIYVDLSTALMDSYLVENKFATMDYREISNDEIKESIFYKRKYDQKYNAEMTKKNLETAKILLSGVPKTEIGNVIVVGTNNYENQKLVEFLEIEFERLGLKTEFKLYDDEDELNEILKKGEFTIFIDNVNLEDENINNRINIIDNYYEGQNYSVIAMYTQNNYWCKSEHVKEIYLDYNGNMIFKKMIYTD